MEEIPAAILVPAVMKKAGVIWLRPEGHAPTAAWHVWHQDACYVLHDGPGEQQIPGLATARRCHVITRSAGSHQRTAEWQAAVSHVAPESEEWAEISPLLLAKRLNLTDADTALRRWARECMVSRLSPAGHPDPASNVG